VTDSRIFTLWRLVTNICRDARVVLVERLCRRDTISDVNSLTPSGQPPDRCPHVFAARLPVDATQACLVAIGYVFTNLQLVVNGSSVAAWTLMPE